MARPPESTRLEVRPLAGAAAPWLHDGAVASLAGRERPPFSTEEYARRHRVARSTMSELQVDAYLVFRPSSVDWLTGFHSGTVLPMPAVVTQDQTFLILPAVEVGRAVAGSQVNEILYHNSQDGQWAQLATELSRRLGHGARVAVDLACGYTPHESSDALGGGGLRPVDGGEALDRARMILSAEEIAAVERAARRTARGVAAAVGAATNAGATDSSVAAAILAAIVPGADSLVRGEVFVATGWRGGVTHSTFADVPLEAGTTTFLEFSGAEHHYVAPVMRTLIHGEPTPAARELDQLARTALEATIGLARPGRIAADIAADVTKELGRLDDSIVFHFTYGYSLSLAHGISWLDAPPFLIHRSNPEVLEEGMLLHLPAVMRRFGEAAVGSSHTVVIEANGPRVLTDLSGPAKPIRVDPPPSK